MTISSINLAMGASSYGAYNQKLTSATKAELEKLGIAYDPNITEAEGKRLIQQKKTQDIKKNNEENLQQNTQKDSLFEKAKKLAQELGINVDENQNFNSLLAIIESTLEQKIQVNSNNGEMLKKLEGLSRELANIQAQSNGSTGYDSTNQALMKSLEIMAQYNMNYLNSDNQKK